MLTRFFKWLLSFFSKTKHVDGQEEIINNKIKEKEQELNEIEKEKENVKETDSLDNNIDYFNNN